MSVTVGELFENINNESIELIAGGGGLNNAVEWVHIVENIEVSTFLEGGEIALITGIGLDGADDLLPLVRCIADNGGSAVIVNTGPHINKIGDDVKSFCTNNNLPLFAVPWHIHIAEVMKNLCFMITSAGKKNMELNAALKSLVSRPPKYDIYGDILRSDGFTDDCFYCTAVLAFHSDAVDAKYADMLNDSLRGYFSQFGSSIYSFKNNSDIVIIIKTDECADSDYAEKIIDDAAAYTYGSGFKHQIIRGIGSCRKGIAGISAGCEEAEYVIGLNRKNLTEQCCIDKTGIYYLLYNVKDDAVKKSFIDISIGSVLKYDSVNNSDLTGLLRSYIKNNGSVQETAAGLNVHRNTVNYKIKKIESITNKNLSEFENRQIMDIGFKLYDVVNSLRFS